MEKVNVLYSPIKAIRQNCLWCCCDSPNEVDLCTISDCPLYPYRFGRRPETSRKRGKEIGNFEKKEPGKGDIPIGLRKFANQRKARKGTQRIASQEPEGDMPDVLVEREIEEWQIKGAKDAKDSV